MDKIFELAQASIKLGGFELKDKLRELTSIMLVGQIGPDEYDILAQLAVKHANGEADPAETNILGALRTLTTELESVKARLAALEAANEEEPVEEEIPEWKPWNGQPGSGYKFGDKVIYLGIKYVSNYIGENVWEPGVQGTEALWTVIT